jgi:hypothetical protein
MGYHIADDEGPILHSVKEIMARQEQQSYGQERVHLYNSAYDWMDTTSESAAKAWGLASGDLSTAATGVRIIYDKMWHGKNQGKRINHIYKCPLCSQEDSQERLFFYCHHEDIVHCRYRLRIAAAEAIQRVTEEEPVRQFVSNVIDYAMSNSFAFGGLNAVVVFGRPPAA